MQDRVTPIDQCVDNLVGLLKSSILSDLECFSHHVLTYLGRGKADPLRTCLLPSLQTPR